MQHLTEHEQLAPALKSQNPAVRKYPPTYAARNFHSRQNAATLSPLRICSEISLRHFVLASLLRFRCVIAQLCYATTICFKMRFT
jgi:hypothetical protein